LWVIPGVVAYFMALGDDPANKFRVSLDVLADQEEGGFEVTRLPLNSADVLKLVLSHAFV
jgi:hypothetical protein